jgi:type IV secretory pathway VirB4 component
MALAGIWTIYIDPKGDALPMSNLPGMEEAKVFDLRQGNDGMLDPFSIGQTNAEKVGLALETIGLFMGGQNRITPQQNVQLSQILKKVSIMPNPSLNKVVDELMAADSDDAKGLGATLDLIRDLPFARLCFAEKTGDALRPDEGLTIITLLGLDLPSSVTPPESYSNSNKLAVAVMYLLASFTRDLMMNLNKSHPKAIVIDEAWAITSTPQGAKLIFEVARMGRSLNTGLVLVSQNAGDFLGEGVTNSISTKLAFRAKQPEEIENVLKFFNLEPHEGNKDIIRELRNGECIIQDVEGRIAIVQVDGWSQEMNYAFETNPETRKTK